MGIILQLKMVSTRNRVVKPWSHKHIIKELALQKRLLKGANCNFFELVALVNDYLGNNLQLRNQSLTIGPKTSNICLC